MRLALLNEKIIGKELAITIYLTTGMVLVKCGRTINETCVKTIKNVGIDTVYIADEYDDVNVKETLQTHIRIEVINVSILV